MTTPTSLAAIIPPVNDHDAALFAAQWHRGSRHLAVRTTPVIAVVQELLSILRDEQTTASQAILALRRTVRLLSVLVAGNRDDDSRREFDNFEEPDPVPQMEDVARSTESVRFAAEWLRGTPAEAIRTEPVIAIVEDLLYSMLDVSAPPSAVYASLRRAVRLLAVFAREDKRATGAHPDR